MNDDYNRPLMTDIEGKTPTPYMCFGMVSGDRPLIYDDEFRISVNIEDKIHDYSLNELRTFSDEEFNKVKKLAYRWCKPNIYGLIALNSTVFFFEIATLERRIQKIEELLTSQI